MKAALIFIMTVLVQMIGLSQQFQLEATIDKEIYRIFDIDGDGVCEYIADTNKVYDGSSHILKYTFPGSSLYWRDAITAQNPYSNFPHIDYNSDGNREVIVRYSNSPSDNGIIVYDLINNQTLFEFNPPEDGASFVDLIDIDGDGVLEMILMGYTNNYPNPDIHKTYIYSTGVTTSVLEGNNISSPMGYKLDQNFPNPFNPSTTIRYSISSPETVSIKIYDVSGQLVKGIDQGHNQAGEYEVIWDGKNNFGERVSSGTYFYQLSVGEYVEAKKMILLK